MKSFEPIFVEFSKNGITLAEKLVKISGSYLSAQNTVQKKSLGATALIIVAPMLWVYVLHLYLTLATSKPAPKFENCRFLRKDS